MATKLTSITFTGVKAEIERYLRTEHNKAGALFSNASPYGQILSVVESLHQLSMLYIKNAITQFDLGEANNFNSRVIKNTALLAGHIPGRAISATGAIRLTVKPEIDLEKEVVNAQITFTNRMTMKNSTNSLFYSLNLGSARRTEKLKRGKPFTLPIIQGKWTTASFTGDGRPMQTINITEIGDQEIENFNVEVVVAGRVYTIKSHLYDLLPDEYACVVRTGFNDGIDVVFGNGGFGKIPDLASPINISYLKSDGSNGNIYRRTINDFKMIDELIDADGNTINIEKVFDVEIHTDINFGSDGETIEFTRGVLPISSNNFVLALPQQFAYHLKRLGVFTHVNAEEKDGTIYIYLTPNIKLFKRQDEDYFSIPIRTESTQNGQVVYSSPFDLDTYEKSKIVKYLKSGGNIMLTSKFIVESPKLSFYSMNIFVMRYSDATQDSVNAQIYTRISNFFLDLKRIDRIPKSDIVRLLSGIRDVHSVDVNFICRNNEEYHKDGALSVEYSTLTFNSSQYTNISSGEPSMYNSTKVIGLDPVLGDIIFNANELPIIRGGWRDRNGVYYSDDSPSSGEGTSLKSVNVITKGVIDVKNRNPL
jgi:hypothetical protein